MNTLSWIVRHAAIFFLIACLAHLSQACSVNIATEAPVACNPGASPEAGGDVSLCTGMQNVLVVTTCDDAVDVAPFTTKGCDQMPAQGGHVWCCVAPTPEPVQPTLPDRLCGAGEHAYATGVVGLEGDTSCTEVVNNTGITGARSWCCTAEVGR